MSFGFRIYLIPLVISKTMSLSLPVRLWGWMCMLFSLLEILREYAELHILGELVRVVYTHSLDAHYEIIGSLLLQVCMFGCS